MKRPDPDKLRAMRVILKAAYDAVLSEETPKNIDATLRELK